MKKDNNKNNSLIEYGIYSIAKTITDGQDYLKMVVDMQKAINDDIKQFWRPLGGIAIHKEDRQVILAQAMVREIKGER